MQRIGVFVCWCGTQHRRDRRRRRRVARLSQNEPGVVFSTNYQYMCSQAGQNMIKDAIKEYGLTGVVICSCSPQNARGDLPQDCRSGGAQPLYARGREHPRAVLLDSQGQAQPAPKRLSSSASAAIAKVNLNTPLTAGE